jgi:hypothetical protein
MSKAIRLRSHKAAINIIGLVTKRGQLYVLAALDLLIPKIEILTYQSVPYKSFFRIAC